MYNLYTRMYTLYTFKFIYIYIDTHICMLHKINIGEILSKLIQRGSAFITTL